MNRSDLSIHDPAAVEAKGLRIADSLTAAALDISVALPMADRLALAVLALAVEAEVARCTGCDAPLAGHLQPLAATLARIEREAALSFSAAPAFVTSTRGNHNAHR